MKAFKEDYKLIRLVMTSIYGIVVTNIIHIRFDRLITRINEYMRRRKRLLIMFLMF